MSIHPQYADAILAGTKRVEFRKRQLAPDVNRVVIYATQPVGRIVGMFEVAGHDIAPPAELWARHKASAGITSSGYRAYYSGARAAVGILVGQVHRLAQPRRLSELPGVTHPPQSFQYLSGQQCEDLRDWMGDAARGGPFPAAAQPSPATATVVR